MKKLANEKTLSGMMRHNARRHPVLLLAAAVVFVVTYILILPALTLDEEEAAQQGGIDAPAAVQEVSDVTSDAEADAPAQFAEGELAFAGNGYSVSASVDAKAGLPLGTELVAEEIPADDKDYDAWCAEALKALQESKGGEKIAGFEFAKFYDISLQAAEGQIEPAAPVNVTISYDKPMKVSDAEYLRIVHFGVDRKGNLVPEVLDAKDVEPTLKKGKLTETAFKAEGFSVYGVVYTVDSAESEVSIAKKSAAKSAEISPEMPYVPAAANAEVPGDVLPGTVSLSDQDIEKIILSADAAGSLRGQEEQSDSNDNSGLEKPVGSKTLEPNNDGTYTLTLSVKGHSNVSSEQAVTKSNILFVMDRSSSMITRTVSDEEAFWYYGTWNQNETTFRGDIRPDTGYQFYGVINGNYVPLSVSPTWANWYGYNLTYWNGYYNQNYPANYPIYVSSKTTRMFAEQNALNNLFTQLLAKNDASGANRDIVELSIISFGDQRFNVKPYRDETEAGWTAGTDPSALSAAASSNRFTSGTNWEEALQYAIEVINAKKEDDGDNEDYYVVFLTDGEPTAVEGNEPNGTPYTGSGANGNIFAYNAAKDEAKQLVDNGINFYNIFTYRTTEDERYSVYLTNYAYGNGDYNDDKNTDAVKKYFADAKTPEQVIDALNNIFYTIEDTIGHGNVSITDTLTTDAMTTTVVQGKTNGYVYKVTDGSGTELYSVTATGDLNNPTVTFKVPSSSVQNYAATSSSVGGKTVYSVTTAEGKVYKMALADVNDQTGELVWDLSSVGILMDNCTYSVSFIVWPDQDAYDYVAALNNGLQSVTDSRGETVIVKWDENAAVDSGKGYMQGGVAEYPSIVKYPNGTFAVLTNTEQKLHYSVVETTSDGTNTETTVTGPYYHELPTPNPMPLTASSSQIEKRWNVTRDPSILAQLLYGSKDKYQIEFQIMQDDNETPYTTVTLGWDGEKYVWEPDSVIEDVEFNGQTYDIGTRWVDSFSIATGLMLSKARMDELGLDKTAYPSAEYGQVTYYILEEGHDYTIKEPGLSYEFDFIAPIYHPMLVDGTLKSVNFTKAGQNITIDHIEEIAVDTDGVSSLKIENTLRGYIHLNKIVVDKNGNTIPTDDTKFEYTVVLYNEDAPFVGDHIPWYGINGLFYHDEDFNYYQATQIINDGNAQSGVLNLQDESGNTYTAHCSGIFNPDIPGPTEVTYTDSSGEEKTIQLYGNESTASADSKTATAVLRISQTEVLNIANVPIGTTYTITESPEEGYELADLLWEIKDGDTVEEPTADTPIPTIEGSQITGTIITNRDNHITYKNKSFVADLMVEKQDSDGQGLEGAVFQLRTVNGSGVEETPVESVRGLSAVTKLINGTETTYSNAFESDGSAHKISHLPDGTYRLYEVHVPAGYINTLPYIEFTVAGRDVTIVTESDLLHFDSASDNTLALLQIENTPGAELPNSGGPGTTWIYLIGAILLLGCGVGLIARRRSRVN